MRCVDLHKDALTDMDTGSRVSLMWLLNKAPFTLGGACVTVTGAPPLEIKLFSEHTLEPLRLGKAEERWPGSNFDRQ